MKIRMNTTAAGPSGVLRAGKVADVPDEQAKAFIQGGYAVPIGAAAEPEKQAQQAPTEPEQEPAAPACEPEKKPAKKSAKK